ncbi:Formylglycine-generating enzyme, required for sulfatase activity, contains SUMF1/FGE domain [Cnuella takakiae]|uniref:Formylglycine-generating enzyme, required for sulfatase activity, contains SUMF1/FGE domain n=1 Tax=Cnuella takakiae TaxID=1302690 RepID=A0A1M4SAF1_9BACT|nr:bifunctional serine/threonine-protein kinase/formylglycine-generating enzyme family protein [Cnuella takakiae]OLY94445.1 hypothetical protein BUE76_23100 [Cnuella takakiae]SHE29170.1 Formylglycine-generating enzyme, required for sulfatase activity, contains SUMF1/FGE domain [Cnuella takakiae]
MDFQTRYEFNPKTDLIGKGGFSKVYRANDTLLERTVALKFFTANASDKYQVLNEIKKVIRFEHPNLCKYYDVAVLTSKNILGETEQAEVGIMEYLDAGDFKTFTTRNPLYTDKLLIDVLEGLAYLHRKGIVHRDLKPQNILIKMVDDEPVAKITDFGISKVIDGEDNASSTLIGTIEYMAPEQFNPKKYGIGGRITTNLDLWSFGLLVYETLMKEPFFGSRSSGTSAEQVMSNILSEASLAKADDLPPKYREIVKRCLVKEAFNRVQNALELVPMFLETGLGELMPKQEKGQVPESATTAYASNHMGNASALPNSLDTNEENTAIVPEPQVDEAQTIAVIMPKPEEEIARINMQDSGATQIISRHDKPVVLDTATNGLQNAAEVRSLPDDQMATRVITVPGRMDAEPTKQQTPNEVSATVTLPRTEDLVNMSPPKNRASEASAIESKRKKRKAAFFIAGVGVAVLVLTIFILSGKDEPKPDVLLKVESKPVLVPSYSVPPLVKVPGGVFKMGEKNAKSNREMEHELLLSSFEIAKYETTVSQFEQFVMDAKHITTAEQNGASQVYDPVDKTWKDRKGVNWRHDMYGALVNNKTQMPVVHISWNDAMAYCKWLAEKDKKHYRLPTEAEWEYAAKGGYSSKGYVFSGSNNLEEVAWYGLNSDRRIHPVGSKKANELGIYDMSGNVMEWCYDWLGENYYVDSVVADPKGPEKGKEKVLRGGSWYTAETVWPRNTARVSSAPVVTGGQLGFRICRELPQ